MSNSGHVMSNSDHVTHKRACKFIGSIIIDIKDSHIYSACHLFDKREVYLDMLVLPLDVDSVLPSYFWVVSTVNGPFRALPHVYSKFVFRSVYSHTCKREGHDFKSRTVVHIKLNKEFTGPISPALHCNLTK